MPVGDADTADDRADHCGDSPGRLVDEIAMPAEAIGEEWTAAYRAEAVRHPQSLQSERVRLICGADLGVHVALVNGVRYPRHHEHRDRCQDHDSERKERPSTDVHGNGIGAFAVPD